MDILDIISLVVDNYRNITSKGRALVALDQSSSKVGWCVSLNGEIESTGEFDPDYPNLDQARSWIKDMVGTLQDDGYTVDVVLESVYLAFFGGKPQAHVYEVLIRTQSHLWAAARDMKANVIEVTAYEAMKALTGISNVHTRREERKKAMIASANRLLGCDVSEHEADAVGLAVAYLQREKEPEPA